MIIAKNILERWNEIKEHTDIELIAKESGLSRVTISNALRFERASSVTIFAIDKFYKEKKKRLTKLKQDGIS